MNSFAHPLILELPPIRTAHVEDDGVLRRATLTHYMTTAVTDSQNREAQLCCYSVILFPQKKSSNLLAQSTRSCVCVLSLEKVTSFFD